jgi:hypothetical protein
MNEEQKIPHELTHHLRRYELIYALSSEHHDSFGDGTLATVVAMYEAARNPASFDIDAEDLDSAIAGDVSALARLRAAWGLEVIK